MRKWSKLDYFENGLLIIFAIPGFIFCTIFYIGLIYSFIVEGRYDVLGFFLILSGIVIIPFGYWVTNREIGSSSITQEGIEYWNKVREKKDRKEKLLLYQRIHFAIVDNYFIKICNKVGIFSLIIGVVLFFIFI
ncbi:hypothetical protein [Aliarcobacter butzleri]|uniref:hypothetical protein n=1 Tax=Aliarcobacter butzleri TaxID=28197 RepID=UPI001EDBB993|nr:hypothetical protein [Aliarcobacter butzleri]MCG3692097.1 hypothetical protein [Aliarcobacter butzleri]